MSEIPKDMIDLIKGSELPEITNIDSCTLLAYENVGTSSVPQLRTGRADLTKITPLFGITQTTGQSITQVISQKAVTDKFEEKADFVRKTDNFQIVYSKDGTLPNGVNTIKDGDTINTDGEYLMLGDGKVYAMFNGGTVTTISIPESTLSTTGYISSDGSFLAGASYKRSPIMNIPAGDLDITIYSFDAGSVARPIAFYTDKEVFISAPDNIGFGTLTTVSPPANATKYALCRHTSYGYKCDITVAPDVTITNKNALIRIIKNGDNISQEVLRDLSNSSSLSLVNNGDKVKADGSYLFIEDGSATFQSETGVGHSESVSESVLTINEYIKDDGSFLASSGYKRSALLDIPTGTTSFTIYSAGEGSTARTLAFYNDAGQFVSAPANIGWDTLDNVMRPTNATKYVVCKNNGFLYRCDINIGGTSLEVDNTDSISLVSKKGDLIESKKLRDFSKVKTTIANRPKAYLEDFLLNNTAITSNTIDIVGAGSEAAMQLKYKSYLSAENLTFAVAFKTNTASSIRIGRHLGGCMKVEGNTLTVYRLNAGLSDYEAHETFTLPFSIEAGMNYIVTCDKIDLFNLRYSISVSTGETFSVIYNKKEVEAPKRTVAIAWGTPFFGVINGDVTVNNAMLLARYDFNTLISIFGDSFIEGTSLIDMGLESKWSTQLSYYIGKQYVHMSGKGGEVADAAFVTRFKVENSLFKSPYVILALGTNHSSLVSYTTYMQQLIDECRTNGQIPILQTIPPRQGINYTSVTKAINDWVKASGELFIDFHAALTTGDGSVWKTGFVLSDGVHPSVAGHNAMTEQVKRDLFFLAT